ncbi:hypothetical protein [Clostridium sp. LIBA-8841]|uniref:hypothetical protein n=1 Tax=Clostridium sp. LIBA-8841 TaxID=2987530 RepID=UPI002AC6261E|nr:hypothetical protein [Clostridium sp. LIBA-8841]MDZ5255312.1 hypothetical protein [Clostridium sp. LIBA-8841]
MTKLLIIPFTLIILFLLIFAFNKNYKYKNLLLLFGIIIIFSLSIVLIKHPFSQSNILKREESSNNLNSDLPLDNKGNLDNSLNNKNIGDNDKIRIIISDTVKKEFGENFKYTKDLIENGTNSYTISLLFDDTNYNKEQCINFIKTLSSNLKSFVSINRIEVFFTNNLKIKYSLSIDNFNKEQENIKIKEDSF